MTKFTFLVLEWMEMEDFKKAKPTAIQFRIVEVRLMALRNQINEIMTRKFKTDYPSIIH